MMQQSQWLVGKKAIIAETGIQDWRTIRKLVDLGAPIARILGNWMSHRNLLSVWLACQLGDRRVKVNADAMKLPPE
ncbi:MAG: hypothetical protein FD177_57 [Desulfovibrionaceae bacterium]|nr:MAG: hypothetical protein FD177_57 [Desulfovibrionaceae bacterium]